MYKSVTSLLFKEKNHYLDIVENYAEFHKLQKIYKQTSISLVCAHRMLVSYTAPGWKSTNPRMTCQCSVTPVISRIELPQEFYLNVHSSNFIKFLLACHYAKASSRWLTLLIGLKARLGIKKLQCRCRLHYRYTSSYNLGPLKMETTLTGAWPSIHLHPKSVTPSST